MEANKLQFTIVFQIPGNKDIKVDTVDAEKYELIIERMKDVIIRKSANIVYVGEHDKDKMHEAMAVTKGFNTYMLCRNIEISDISDEEEIYRKLTRYIADSNYIDMVERAYTYQILSLYYIDTDIDD